MAGTELQSGAAHCRVKDTTRRRTAQSFSFCGNAVTTNCVPPNFATAGQRRHIVLTRMAPQARVAAAAGS